MNIYYELGFKAIIHNFVTLEKKKANMLVAYTLSASSNLTWPLTGNDPLNIYSHW